MLTAVAAEKLFDGTAERPLARRHVLIRDGRIEAVVAGDPALPSEVPIIETPLLAPGFIDMQINGGGDVLFNDTPTADGIDRIAAAARQGGAAHILPTFITAAGQDYRRAIRAVGAALDLGIPGVLGLHLEGPFLSPTRPGIHEAEAIRRIESEDVLALKAFRAGVRLITLAPEEQPAGVIGQLSETGWVVFAGHSDAGAEAMTRAAGEGLKGVTHLFNAMRQIGPREPGVVGSALDDARLYAGIIADGHHVHAANLRLASSSLGADRLCLVSDAMPTLGGKSRSFTLAGKTIRLDGGRLVDETGRLAGAHLSMADAVRTLVRDTGMDLALALRTASTTPARALGLGDELGRIVPGFRASLTLLDEHCRAQGVMVDGRFFSGESAIDG